jgi:hypothetical protein
MQGKLRWDEIFPNSDEVQKTAVIWLKNIDEWNGRPWHAQPIGLHVSSDASDFGYGGLVLLPDGSKVPVSENLTEEEVLMSSTAREVIGFNKLPEATAHMLPEQVRNSTVQVLGDNQAAVQAINQFRSRASDVNDALKEIFAICVRSGFNVSAVWKPRDMLEAEDLLSRQPDASDWGICKKEFETICAKFKVKIEIDLFASDTSHVSPKFVSLLYTPGCSASQALLQDWRLLVRGDQFAWIFPPVRIIPEVIQLFERYKTSILVVPEQSSANWWIRLFAFKLAKGIQRHDIPRGTGSCRASHRVPSKTANPGLFKLKALRIEW